jgi:hypothetical protein
VIGYAAFAAALDEGPVGVEVRAGTAETAGAAVRDGGAFVNGAPGDGAFVIGAPVDGLRAEGAFVIGAPGDNGLVIADDELRADGAFVIGAPVADGLVIADDELRADGAFVIGTPVAGVRDDGAFALGAAEAGAGLNRVVGGSSELVADGGARPAGGNEMRSATFAPSRATSTTNRRAPAVTCVPGNGSVRSMRPLSDVPCSNVEICARVTGCGVTARYSAPTRIAIGRSTPITSSLTSD